MASTQIPTAKIYQFPVKAKTSSGARHDASAKRAASVYADCGAGEAWYHEAAIAEAVTAPKLNPGRR